MPVGVIAGHPPHRTLVCQTGRRPAERDRPTAIDPTNIALNSTLAAGPILSHFKSPSTASILVQPDGTAKLTDFGLAKDHSGADDQQLTRADAKPAAMRSDVYSLGGALYHLLTGRPSSTRSPIPPSACSIARSRVNSSTSP